MTKLVLLLHRRAAIFISLLVVASLALGLFATRIGVDNSLKVWFVEGDPTLTAYEAYKREFGNDEMIVIAVVAPPGGAGIYEPAYLERIRAASTKLQGLRDVRRVQSLAVSLHATNEGEDMVVGPLLPEIGAVSVEDAAAVRRRVAIDPQFQGVLVSDKGADRISMILVEPRADDPDATPPFDYETARHAILGQVGKIVDAELRKDGARAHLGGIGVVYDGLNDAALKDTTLFVSLSYVILLLGLWLTFRRVVWVLIGAAIVSVTVLATMGLAGLAGRDMNMVTGIVPTLIMTVAILDLVHLVEAYEEGASLGLAREQILRTTVAVCVVPCIVNSGTDVIGFASFIQAPVGAIRDLGWLVSAGLAILLLSVLVIGIPALAKWGGRKPKDLARASRPARDGVIGRLVLGLLGVATRRRNLVLASAVVLFGLSAWGISRLTADTYTIGFLPEDHVVRQDHDAIERQFGPYVPLEFTVESVVADQTIFEPTVLTAIEATERAFEEHDRIGAVTGLPEIVKQVSAVFSADQAEYRIPDKRAGVVQLLDTVYGQSTDGEDNLNALLDNRAEPRRTHITARSGLPSANTIARTLADLDDRAEPHAATIDVRPAGYVPLYTKITQNITAAQIQSVGSAFVLVMIVMMLLLRSVKLGIVAMVPNALPAMMTLGMMGFVGIPLDLATVLIAGIVLGISVNDTSHIMFRYRHELAQDPGDPHGALERMMIGTGRPVVMASLTLLAGFAVLMLASVKSVFYFGLLTTITTLCALLCDLLITPALMLAVSRPKPPEARALASGA